MDSKDSSESGSLVLTRKQGQVITIGDNVTIEVARITGNAVRIRIVAPKYIQIYRGGLKKESE